MKGRAILKYGDDWFSFSFKDELSKRYKIDKLLNDIEKGEIIFSIQIEIFLKDIEEYNSSIDSPKLVDIESFSKQFIQKAKPLTLQKRWSLFKLMKEMDILLNEYQIDAENIDDYLKYIAVFIQDILNKTKAEELDRFFKIEIPINDLIYKRQRLGIAINSTILNSKIQKLEKELYSLKNTLQLTHNVYSPENKIVQLNFLEENNINVVGSLERTFKNHQDHSDACGLFYQQLRTKKDLDCLLYLKAAKGSQTRTFPSYIGFGTITSRITLREPALQNLRRRTREIISADPGYKLLYIDFSQFEAGILAHLSKDKLLINLYDSDIYKDISEFVNGTDEKRGKAKTLFYRNIYGDKSLEKKEKAYFLQFIDVQKYTRDIIAEAKKKGKIGTDMGNNRIITEDYHIALSHKIQATASLIFKTALIEVDKTIKNVDFILPMHDAALYQCKSIDFEDLKVKISEIFINVFKEYCPSITPKVKEGGFYIS
ncbi:DNA polymerase [Aquimarina aquimarini]|uniref:DNA polymerase n=1 Tax=Aquimarina aquimarini TaxID=1191734 RepID=UPI000D555CBB|nr:DNA polymerase [Aquimarina aquimarini]